MPTQQIVISKYLKYLEFRESVKWFVILEINKYVMSNLWNETEFIMKKYHIKANKNLGQNFLIDEQVIEKIVN